MTADILAEIDDMLEHWNGSLDSARWRPPPVWSFPRLSHHQAAVARTLAAQTGVDGYAAVLMVADVAERGLGSPHAGEVAAAAAAVAEEVWQSAAAAVRQLIETGMHIVRQLAAAFAPVLTLVRQAAIDLGPFLRALETPPPMPDPRRSAMHRTYHERSRARRRRRRG